MPAISPPIDADAILACILSLVIGTAIGIEREWRGQSAGVRTHLLVVLSSTLLMLAAGRQVAWHVEGGSGLQLVADPVRMAHGVLTGIGFLCAGTIFRERFSVHGLTTAASLWVTAALGIACARASWHLIVLALVVTLMLLVAVLPLDRYLDRRHAHRQATGREDEPPHDADAGPGERPPVGPGGGAGHVAHSAGPCHLESLT
jgi:putative Mg2+ transporter-C (MgtC) family protein